MSNLIKRLRMGTQLPEFELRQDAADEIERLRKQKQIAVDALFSICQSDWSVGYSRTTAHKAIKELTALEDDDG